MIVFGNGARRESVAAKLAAIRASLANAAALPAGLARHSALVTALIEAGELLQGVADVAFHRAGDRDGAAAPADAATVLAMALAAACARSWSSGFADIGLALDGALDRAAASLADAAIAVRRPEGYAYYLLYPEAYLEAAWRCADRACRWQVIGVRSIGTSLACIVAVGLGAPAPITLRPVGDPFARRIAAGRDSVDAGADRYAIVDEGPGLSGSSIAAVARWLGEAGIGEERIHFFVAHRNGPGREADAAIRAIWQRAAAGGRVHAVSFDEIFLDAAEPSRRLARWVEALIGPLQEPLSDVSGGAWRMLRGFEQSALPPAHPWQERRKFVAVASGRRWLVKFAGLGRTGEHALARARDLARAGFVAQPIGLCHGFLVEAWRDDTTALSETVPAALQGRLVETVAAYLAHRARAFPAAPDSGASLHELHAMARCNAAEGLGSELAAALSSWQPELCRLATRVQRVETDSRMHRWEWLVGADAILKADALDHHAGHDLIGCQDIAWDVAGAIIELDLAGAQERRLRERMASHGAAVSPELLAFLHVCYAAFQLGAFREAERASDDREEAARLRHAGDRYASSLRRALAAARCSAAVDP